MISKRTARFFIIWQFFLFLGELFLGKAPALSQWKKLLPCLMNAVYLSLSSQKIQAQFCLNHGCCPVPLFCRALYLLKSICPFKQGFEYQKDLTNHLFLLFDMIKTSRLSAWNPSPLFRRHRSWPWETPCSEQTLNRLDVSPHSNFSRIWHNRFSESPGVFILSLFGMQGSICYGVRHTFSQWRTTWTLHCHCFELIQNIGFFKICQLK